MATAILSAPIAPSSGVHPKKLASYIWCTIGFLVVLVLAFGIKHKYESKQNEKETEKKVQMLVQECSKSRSCTLPMGDDSSDVIDVPEGKTACFEPWIWKHLDEVGLMISYQDQKGGEPFPCSSEQVFGGSCTAVYDRFWFKPPHKTTLPKYWLVASGSKQC